MNSFSKQNRHWYSALTVTVECVVCWLAVSAAPAQESASPVFVASLATPTLQPELILNRVHEQPASPALQAVAPTDRSPPLLQRKPTDTEAWERFEAEYRLVNQSPLLVKRQVETAKYGLDVTVFAVDRFVKSIRDHTDFEFDQGHLRRTRANARGGFLDNPRVKLDLDMQYGRPYIGARLVIPFGN